MGEKKGLRRKNITDVSLLILNPYTLSHMTNLDTLLRKQLQTSVFGHQRKPCMLFEYDELSPYAGVCDPRASQVNLSIHPSPLYLFKF
jgi:hypothetical protein